MAGKRVIPFALALILCLITPVMGADPSGWWNSSTGSKILIWAKKERVVVTVKDPQGKHWEYPGKWLEAGEEFHYEARKEIYKATFIDKDEIEVVNQSTGFVTTWKRIIKTPKAHPSTVEVFEVTAE